MGNEDIRSLRVELKKIFIGYRTVTKSMNKRLKKLGLRIEEGGKHYRISNESNQCLCIMAKTPSDYRSGYNLVSCLCNRMAYVE